MDEKTYNNHFGQALSYVSGWGGEIHAETPGMFKDSNRQADLFLDKPKFPPIIFECKFSESTGDVVSDVERKLGLVCSDKPVFCAGDKIDFGVAVKYPANAKKWMSEDIYDKFLESTLLWKFVRLCETEESVRWPREGWLEGNISDLVESVSRTVVSAEEIIDVSNSTVSGIKSAAKTLEAKLRYHPKEIERISVLMGAPALEDEYGSKLDTNSQAGLRVACLVWLDAMIMLDELCEYGVIDISTKSCLSVNGKMDIDILSRAWRDVLRINYDSVFRPALDAVPSVLSARSLTPVFDILYEQVKNIDISNLGGISNIGGEIYARLMATGQRKRVAAYYTLPEVAEYLAVATLPDALPGNPLEWRVADFACGTGTLLRAAYRRLRQFAAAKQVPLDEFHKSMMSNGICGMDISVIASHLTVTGLVSVQPEIPYQDTNVGVHKIGRATASHPKHIGDVSAGSLELALNKNPVLFSPMYEVKQGLRDTEKTYSAKAEDGSFDTIIMNPPYSRTRAGQPAFDIAGLTDTDRNLIQKRTKHKIIPNSGGNMQAGVASLFVGIADKKLKENGRLGFVLPMTIAAQSSWASTRKMIAENYSDIMVTYFRASGNTSTQGSMSADTRMGEILLTARKGKKGRAGILYVCIHAPFSFASEAAETARVVQHVLDGHSIGDTGTVSIAGSHVGDWYWHPSSEGTWGGTGVSQLTGFFAKADSLTKGAVVLGGKSKTFPIALIKDIFSVGPTHHIIGHVAVSGKHQTPTDPIGAFTLYPYNSTKKTPDVMLWHADGSSQSEIAVDPTHYGTVRPNSKSQANKRRAEKTDMFMQRKMGWGSQRVLVAKTDEAMLGGALWAGLRNEDDVVRFAFAVWGNSIFGFISHWHQTGRQQPGRSMVEIRGIRELRCPDFRESSMRKRAEKVMAESPDLFHKSLDRAKYADTDPVRRELDIAAGLILGFTIEESETLAEELSGLWCAESSVSKKYSY